MRHGRGVADTLTAAATHLAVWPTPTTRDHKDGSFCPNVLENALLGRVAWQAGWPTPSTPSGGQTWPNGTTAEGLTPDGRKLQVTLGLVADQAGWATPVGQPANGTPEAFLERKRKSMRNGSQSMGVVLSDLNMQVQAWAGWPTPTAKVAAGGEYSDPDKALERVRGPHANDLRDFAKLTDMSGTLDGPARLTADGRLLTGSTAGMDAGGQLNPAHSRWLMLCRDPWEQWAPGYQDWQLWQALTSVASPPQSVSAPEPCAGSEMPS